LQSKTYTKIKLIWLNSSSFFAVIIVVVVVVVVQYLGELYFIDTS